MSVLAGRAGRVLLPTARNILAAGSAARDVVDELHRGLRGTIRLGVNRTGRRLVAR